MTAPLKASWRGAIQPANSPTLFIDAGRSFDETLIFSMSRAAAYIQRFCRQWR
ncbi:hypothetical protein K788_0001602 (plasmid) [Paraburkholderia caribensis MBA4]|uniref:Uncharacterized protein n=1 Tax=Paraburkholderia caribensis MBA4 TaxID=1323664 RepID=A0A0P0RMF7_9BURK|nr:hypothetical protein K788_0001602 [Paraburkholderia caribensis MBA4]